MSAARTANSLFLIAVVGVALFLAASRTQVQELRTDIPPLIEIDRLDPEGSHIERFAFTARGAMALEVPIPGSKNRFCTLEHEHNVVLNYYPARDQWVFQVQSNDSAQYAAGGIATCLDLAQVPRARTP